MVYRLSSGTVTFNTAVPRQFFGFLYTVSHATRKSLKNSLGWSFNTTDRIKGWSSNTVGRLGVGTLHAVQIEKSYTIKFR